MSNNKEELYKQLSDSIVEMDEEETVDVANEVIE